MVKSARKVVPAALHSELSEYASLLRALRTSDTLDLASQLTKPASPTPSTSDDDEPVSRAASLPERPPSSLNAEAITPQQSVLSISDSRPTEPLTTLQVTSKRKHRTRDTWTRWPLMAGDVYVPEWSLVDEVELIATRALRTHLGTTHMLPNRLSLSPMLEAEGAMEEDAVENTMEDSDEDSEDHATKYVQTSMRATAFAAEHHLSSVLGALSAYVPATAGIMQNRKHPIGWETVLDVAGACGLADAQTLESVRRRMERVQGVSISSLAPIRSDVASGPAHHLRNLLVECEQNLLSLPEVVEEEPRKKRKYSFHKRKPAARKSTKPTLSE